MTSTPHHVRRDFRPGFRLSATDVVALFVGGVASAYVMTIDQWYGLAIAFVVLHFFLFCNVLRMSRPLELIWAGVFIALAAATLAFDRFSWPAAFGLSTLVTLLVGTIEARRPSYHGIAWQRLNPRLPDWWRSQESSR